MVFGQHFLAGESAMLQPAVATARPAGATTSIRPVLRPHPRIWVAANNDRAVERAAEIGDTWIINPHATLGTIERQMELYRAARARAGKAYPAELPMMREICVADSRAAAYRLARPQLEKKYQAYVAWGQHRALPDGDDMTLAFDQLVRDRFILGDPSECVEHIQRCVAATGATTMVFRVHWPGMPHEEVVRALRVLAAQVRPQLAWPPIAPASAAARRAGARHRRDHSPSITRRIDDGHRLPSSDAGTRGHAGRADDLRARGREAQHRVAVGQ